MAVSAGDLTAVTEGLGVGAPLPGRALPGRERGGLPSWIGGTIGMVILVVVWEVLALTVFHSKGSGVPTPTATVSKLWSDLNSGLYGRNLGTTLSEALTGYLVANVLAIVIGITFVQVPRVERALLNVAVASYCLPIIAIGPILTFALHGNAPKSALAGLLVFFPSMVGVATGLRSADRASLEVIRASGGGRWAQLLKVRLRAALPSTFAALQIAAPSALLGAVIGEYLGSQTRGLGIMMIEAEAGFQTARLWGIALLLTLIGGAGYVITGIVGRVVAPWAPRPGRSR
jgi:ABC-type nitrate/sulfonate/bicarbonate transport system permease component